MRARVCVALAVFGCGSDAEPPPTTACEPPARVVNQRCLDPGVQDDGCPAGTAKP